MPSSVPTAPARPRSSACSPAKSLRKAASSGSTEATSRDLPCTAAAGSGSLARSRSRRCFSEFTALDNVALAVQAHSGHSFRFWRDARRNDAFAPTGAGGACPRRARCARQHARRQAQSWRASPARNCDGARHQAAHAAPRRAHGRHGAGRIRPHGGDAAQAQGQHHHPVDRARYGDGVRAGGSRHRPGLWPRHRQRRSRGDQGRSRRARSLSWRTGSASAHG